MAHTVVSRLYLAASLYRIGSPEAAGSEIASAREEVPGISIAMLEHIEAYRDPAIRRV